MGAGDCHNGRHAGNAKSGADVFLKPQNGRSTLAINQGKTIHFREVMMRFRCRDFALAAALAALSCTAALAQSTDSLTGKVTSAQEGAMEGVVVSAKKAGGIVTVS